MNEKLKLWKIKKRMATIKLQKPLYVSRPHETY